MAVAAPSHGEVSIAIARDPALVRTVRLVAAAVARRADHSDSVIEEIRLAVGEACALMIGIEEDGSASDDRVSVAIHSDGTLTVTVTGRVVDDSAELEELGLDPFALIRGLSENLAVERHGDLTTLEMTWAL